MKGALLLLQLASTSGDSELLFRDVTVEAGIDFRHHSAPEKKYIVESMSGGVALFDYDGDGLVDIYLVDSLTVETASDPKAARSALYRNRGGGKFEDVTDRAGIGHPGWGMGVCTADIDGNGREDVYVDRDECNRPDTTLEGLGKLPPHFDPGSGHGTVTAGNSSQLSDGASATLLMSRERAERLGIRPKLVFRGFVVAGCAPDEMGIGPVYAVPRLLARHGLRVEDIDLWELNEAFAVQVVYCRDRLGLDPAKLNVNGGSIAIGHPFGMTGSRLVGTLANELARRRGRYGVVTMCVGGGQGAAGLFEVV